MTSTAPAHRAAPQMTHTPDPTTTPQAQAVAPFAEAKPARSRLRDQIAENPLAGLMLAVLTFLGTVAVALLIFTLNSLNESIDRLEVSLNKRIDDVETRLGERIDRLEARFDSLEDKVDAGFASQGAQIAELDRKLTALIAHLNATEAVDAALEHRLLVPDAGALESDSEPPG